MTAFKNSNPFLTKQIYLFRVFSQNHQVSVHKTKRISKCFNSWSFQKSSKKILYILCQQLWLCSLLPPLLSKPLWKISIRKSSDICWLVTVNFYIHVALSPLFKMKASVNLCYSLTAFFPLELRNVSHAGCSFQSSSAQTVFVQIATPHLETQLLAILPNFLLGYSWVKLMNSVLFKLVL